jgi:ribose/xylose/arabinose/galactoside ABC-type transport system permease subunit
MTTTVAPALARSTRRLEVGRRIQQQGALVALAALLVFAAVRYDNFVGQNITDMLTGNVKFGLIALGMTLVIMTGGIDLSVGSVVFLGAVVAAQLGGSGLGVSFAGAVAAGAVIGLVNALLITRVRLQPFVATLATLLFTRGLSLTLSNGRPAATSGGGGFRDAQLAGVPVSIVLMVLLFVVGAAVVRYTAFGRYVLAVGGNEDASRLMGLPVDRTKAIAYVISGVLAGLAGAVYAGQNASVATSTGQGYELVAIAAVVVGGTLLTGGVGSVLASLIGVLLLQLILNLINFENAKGTIAIGAEWAEVVQGVFLLLVVLLQVVLVGKRGRSV